MGKGRNGTVRGMRKNWEGKSLAEPNSSASCETGNPAGRDRVRKLSSRTQVCAIQRLALLNDRQHALWAEKAGLISMHVNLFTFDPTPR